MLSQGAVSSNIADSLVISPAAISDSFKERISDKYQLDFDFTTLSMLRKLSLPHMVKQLRAKQFDTVVFSIEDQESLALLPILSALSLVIRADKIFILTFDGNEAVLTRRKGLASIFSIFTSTVSGLLAIAYIKLRSTILEKQSILNVQFNNQKMLMLNANLWYGVKAGGSVGHIAGVANGFARKSYRVNYIATSKNPQLDDDIQQSAFQNVRSNSFPSELNYYQFNQRHLGELKKLIKNNDLGYIYQRLSIANYMGVLLSRSCKIPLVVEYNGSEVWVANNWGNGLHFANVAKTMEDLMLKHAHIVVTISDVLKQELIERGVSKEKIVCYPNCVDPIMFDPNQFSLEQKNAFYDKHSIPRDSLVLTFIGTFGVWHGVDILAKSIKLLLTHSPDFVAENKLHFLLVGDGQKKAEVEEILGDFCNHPAITFTGIVPQNQPPLILACSDILLSPHVDNKDKTKFFGSPTKLYEYMISGKAIIASALGQIAETLSDSISFADLPPYKAGKQISNEVSVLVEPGNEVQLAEAIKFLVLEPTAREQLGNNSRTLALDKYTWSHHVDAIIDKM